MQVSRLVYSGLIVGAMSVIGASAASAAPVVLNPGFESPALNAGTFVEGTPPTNWTNIAGSTAAGVVSNGSAYSNTAAPEGTQALLLKGAGGAQQTLSGFDTTTTSYVLSFYAEGRIGNSGPPILPLGPNTIAALVDGVALTFTGSTSITPVVGSYTLYTSDPFTVTSATPTLTFTGAGPGDVSSFIDSVAVNTPEPASLGVLGIASLALFARRRRSN